MTAICANGHESTWPDWCSTCGARMPGADVESPGSQPSAEVVAAPAEASPGAAADPTATATAGGAACANCGVARHEHDVFCESCGYDFASGSLPEAPDVSSSTEDETATPIHVRISVDAEFFSSSIGDVELQLPDPIPESQLVPLAGIRILIGRQSTSRGVFPEIDVRALTADPAVSSRHAMLERGPDHRWTLTDLGSTNGTFLTPAADEPVPPGVALPVSTGTVFYLGAWTRIELAPSG